MVGSREFHAADPEMDHPEFQPVLSQRRGMFKLAHIAGTSNKGRIHGERPKTVVRVTDSPKRGVCIMQSILALAQIAALKRSEIT